MTVYCVSYDLNKPGQNYDSLYEELENSTSRLHFLDSTWLIYTRESANQLLSRLLKHIDLNDCLLVIEVTSSYAGRLPDDAWKWIKDYV